MHREQGVLAGAGAVHPGQPAFDAESGLVEPGHVAAGDLLAGLLEEPAELPGGAGGQRATVPDDSGMPNSSASALAVRCFDKNCPADKKMMTAATRGP
jgi:hypothetical protein